MPSFYYRLAIILSLLAILFASPTLALADVALPLFPILTPLATDTTTPSSTPQPTATLAPTVTMSPAPSAIPTHAPSSTPIGAPTATPTPVTVTFPCGSALLTGMVVALVWLKRYRPVEK